MKYAPSADALRQLAAAPGVAGSTEIDPVNDLGFVATPDPDIERAFNWLVGLLPDGDWARRKAAVEEYVESLFKPSADPTKLRRVVGSTDKIGWYLYLVETAQHEPFRTDVFQAARVLPVFKRFGIDLDKLQTIKGIDAQAARLLSAKTEHPDSVLFEMLVALLWAKNDWQDVSFVPTLKKQKRPDIRASDGTSEWSIETKRLVSNSEYGLREREKWLRMWGRLSPCLHENRYGLILDITFHVELKTLSDSFLLDQLESKLKLVATPCQLVSNDTWDVSVQLVDFDRIHKHLGHTLVKKDSPYLQELISGRPAEGEKFTFLMLSSQIRLGGNRGFNLYVTEIDWAACAFWHCDAEHAIDSKARDIASHVAAAAEQLPASGNGVIQVGLDTPDGAVVEMERYKKIAHNLMKLDKKGKAIGFVYVNLYHSFWPAATPWVMDETVYKFGANATDKEPLSHHSTIVSENAAGEGKVHWLRD